MQLSQAQLEEFDHSGFLFLHNAFAADEVRVLKAAATEVYALERDEVWREKSGVAPIEALADDCLRELAAPAAAEA